MGDAPGPGTDEQTRPPPMDEDTFLQGLAHCLQTVRGENPALIPGARRIPKGAGREAVSPAAVTSVQIVDLGRNIRHGYGAGRAF